MQYPDKIRKKAIRIVEEQRAISASKFTARDIALVNRISANMSVAHMNDFSPSLLSAYSELQVLVLSAKRKREKDDKDANLPEGVYALVSALKAISGQSGQTIAALRDSKDANMDEKEALVLAEELQEAARKIKALLDKVKS